MKTTLVLPDTIAIQLKREAARHRSTMSDIVVAALRRFFESQKAQRHKALKPLPTFDGGGPPLVDVADREALYSKMGGRW